MSKARRRTPRKRSSKGFFQSLLVLAISIVIVLLIAEAAVYLLHRERIVLFPRYVTDVRRGDFHVRGNIPNATYRHKSVDGTWWFGINANGFRDDRDFEYEKPETITRILVLGDSFTIGYEVQQQETYSAVLERCLRKRGLEVEVLNAGMSGSSTAEELVFFEQEGLRYDPDIVVIGFYWNDLQDNLKANLYRLDDGELKLNATEYVPAVRIRNRLNAIPLYGWLSQRSYFHNYLNNVATEYFKKAMLKENMAALERSSGLEPADIENYKNELGRALVSRITEIAHAHGAGVVLLDIASWDLESSFPWSGDGDVGTVADVYVDTAPLLAEYEGLAPLRAPHGHGHWSPLSHLVAGVELGRVIAELMAEE
ncbi:MAG: GDSL-type esterase/lipase family protein [Candidatus Eisenbacteria bacterium]